MILIVDDHMDTRTALVHLLKFEGYEARGVASGAEAFVLLSQFKPKAIILDYNMPDMDGLNILAAIRRDAEHAAVPVIMYSAHALDEVRDKAIKAGANAYVSKASLDWMELHKVIAQFAGPAVSQPNLPPEPDIKEVG